MSNRTDQPQMTVREPWSMKSREGLIPWLRRVIAGNPTVDAEIARLRQELEWANARAEAMRMAADRDGAENGPRVEVSYRDVHGILREPETTEYDIAAERVKSQRRIEPEQTTADATVEVTPEMIEAGKRELLLRLKHSWESEYLLLNEDIAAVWVAMEAARAKAA